MLFRFSFLWFRCCCDVYRIYLYQLSFQLSLSTSRLYLQTLLPDALFQSIILVEPLLSPKGDSYLAHLRTELVKGAYERRDSWPSREDARAQLLRNPRIRAWSPLVLDCYVVGDYLILSTNILDHRDNIEVRPPSGIPWICNSNSVL